MPSATTQTASTVDYLTAERDVWRNRALLAEQALESLTPGGSEFHGSPANCAEWIGKRMASVTQHIKARQAAEARAEAAEQERNEWKRRAEDAEAGQERSEQLRAAAVVRENNAIGERDIARRQTAALERLAPPMKAIYWIVEHLKQTTPEVATVREWLQRLETERE
jgi:hypothetical protein